MTPSTLPTLLRHFADADVFMRWLADRRWANGFTCAKCGETGALAYPDGRRRCKACRARVRPLSGTALENFHAPHEALLLATWSLADIGTMSASRLARESAISRPTAMLTLRKIRIGLLHAQDERAPELMGDIEVDEAYIGGSRANTGKRGRSATPAKHLILCAVERGAGGRCVMRRRDKATKVALRQFIAQYVATGADLHTDGYVGYAGIDQHGYAHHPTVIHGGELAAHEALPVVHQAISLCKRCMLSAYNRQPDAQHMDGYLAEFCFRWNTRALSTGERFQVLWDELLAAPHQVRR